MAKRESQGLQITLIAFVMFTIIFLATTILFWNRSTTLLAEAEKLRAEKAELNSAADTALDHSTRMKVWIGHAADTGIEEIEQQYNRDMATYGRSAQEAQRTYKDVPALLFAALQDRNKQATDLRSQMQQLEQEMNQKLAQKQTELDDAIRIQGEKDAELLRSRSEFETARNQLNSEKSQLLSQLEQSRGELEQTRQQLTKQLDDAQREMKNQELIISQRDGQLAEFRTESFEVPDGKIQWVNPRTGMVYINLGSDDGLRRQVTFSVYGVDVNNLAREDKKGAIEVTRIVNGNLAEARITEDQSNEPILAGDVIYTPLWNAKSALRFGLAGTIDINGDGKDDSELVKRLIRINNGTVDAEIVGGQVQGELSHHTRYLIVGDAPTVADEESAGEAARQNAWSQMMADAKRYGIEQMSVEKMLDFVGYDGDKRTIPLGDDADPDDFVGGATDQGEVGSVFREREPRSRRRGF